MMLCHKKTILQFVVITFFAIAIGTNAQTINIDASKLLQHVLVSVSPSGGTFTEGSTFEVPIVINTKGSSINSVEIRVNFDRDKLAIISSSNGVSIIGIWIEPPKYDNSKGTASYIGVIPNGVTTESGFVGTITFKAIKSGKASVSVASNSRVLLNDGLGTNTILDLRRAEYSIVPKAPDGVNIFSETHPFQSEWYNNNSPIISWDLDKGVQGFSYEFDNKPSTVPPNEINTTKTTQTYEKLNDGLWYFHIKANKSGAWGNTGHFLVRIDTTPPAVFTPEVDYLVAAVTLFDRALVSFFTTDNLSGIDHYEVGIVDKSQPITESPIFVQAESPFQVPMTKGSNLRVIVRAFDKAQNIRDASIDIQRPSILTKFIDDNLIFVLLLIIIVGFVSLLIHYLFGHHIIRSLQRFREFAKKEDQDNDQQTKI